MATRQASPASLPDLKNMRRRLARPLWLGWKRARQRMLAGRAPRRWHVFVAGSQRSGTNMLMEALEGSPHTDVYHESDTRAFDDYLMRPMPAIRELAARSPAPIFVVKALCEIDRVPRLLETFRPATCVWLYRDYRDVANSMLVSFRTVPATVRRLAGDEPASVGWWGQSMSADTHRLIQDAVSRDVSDATMAALLWYARNALLFESGLDRDERVFLMNYEELVSNPDAHAGCLCEFLDLPFTSGITRHMHARSIGRRGTPDIDGNVAEACELLLERLHGAKRAQEV
ncbi:MAG: sulfotransferase [Spiribacter salinus]|uniref:Sulfotransferase n=1 Tax=Spiribacter salinus TaxID=1335746 RepID=A0A540VQI4_9GAMM|nr:MAG: sulfotransferase [Spiribacter salinus]